MEITQAELLRRLSSSKNLTRPASSIPPKQEPAKSEPPKQAPPKALKIVAGSLAKQGVPVDAIASTFNLSTTQVHSAKNSKSPAIKGPIQSSLERVQELAIDKMMLALGLMDRDKFESASLKDLSIVTANMSKVIEKTRAQESDNRVQLVIYAPEQRVVNGYRVIDV